MSTFFLYFFVELIKSRLELYLTIVLFVFSPHYFIHRRKMHCSFTKSVHLKLKSYCLSENIYSIQKVSFFSLPKLPQRNTRKKSIKSRLYCSSHRKTVSCLNLDGFSPRYNKRIIFRFRKFARLNKMRLLIVALTLFVFGMFTISIWSFSNIGR